MSINPHPPAPRVDYYVPLPVLPMWTLWCWRLWSRTASGKEGGRNTETEVTRRAWHKGLQKLTVFFYTVIDEDEDDNWQCYESICFSLRLHTHSQTTLSVIIITVLTRPRNCSTCSVGWVIRATNTLKKEEKKKLFWVRKYTIKKYIKKGSKYRLKNHLWINYIKVCLWWKTFSFQKRFIALLALI